MEVLTETIEHENLTVEEFRAEPLDVLNNAEIAPVYEFNEEVQKDWRAEKRLLIAEIFVILTIIAILVVRYFVLLGFK